MRVMVTGGTGFVGSHSVAALLGAGHEVRLLVRSPGRIAPALAPLGLDLSDRRIEVAIGDVTDQAAVEAALHGCDAALHGAAVYSLHPRQADEMGRTNVAGAEIVLGTAARLKLDPIVHVSSLVALMGRRGQRLSTESEPGEGGGAYMRSKAAAEVVARRMQAEGHPIVITYPGSVWGPHDPNYGETCVGVRFALQRWYTLGVSGGLGISDVRDIARLHAAVMAPRRGPRRYLGPARYTTFSEMMRILARVTGRRLPCLPMPWWTLDASMRAADVAQRYLPFRIPFNHQLAHNFGLAQPVDDGSGRQALGSEPHTIAETVRDTVRWLAQTGYISRALAGSAA